MEPAAAVVPEDAGAAPPAQPENPDDSVDSGFQHSTDFENDPDAVGNDLELNDSGIAGSDEDVLEPPESQSASGKCALWDFLGSRYFRVTIPKRRSLKFYMGVGVLGLTLQYMGLTGGIAQFYRYCVTGIGQVGGPMGLLMAMNGYRPAAEGGGIVNEYDYHHEF